MDYGSLIRQAWQYTWRFKFLWVLGLFAPSTVGSCSSSPGGGGSVSAGDSSWTPDRIAPELGRAMGETGNWFMRNMDIILLVAVLAALIGFAFFVVSIIAQGAMARGTADVALGRPVTLGQAWGTGLRLFWRYLGLLLVLIGLFILVAILIGILVALAVLVGSLLEGSAQMAFVIISVLVGIVFFLAVIALSVAIGVAAAFAQRAIAVEDVGPIHALRIGFGLLRGHAGSSALVWLISLGLGIGVGLAILLATFILLLPLGGVVAILFITTGASGVSIAFTVIAAILLIAGLWFLSAIANTFFWHYWTLTYLNFTGRLTRQLEVQEG